ncbi:hypothetical protein [Nitrosophilus labii]|uniref:hypothetical protein n=1 Tax=Nitrosophilus labii TaxID=2706014 RepID=UPI001656DA50|nr:hypothetical protein [Nitrosophilus labii]
MNSHKAKKLLNSAKASVYSGDGKEERAFTIRANIQMIITLQSSIKEAEEAILALFDDKPLSKEDEEAISDI